MPSRTIAAGLLSASLLIAAASPALAQDENAREPEPISMADAAVASLFRALDVLPAVLFPDARAPQALAEYVPAAREQLTAIAGGGPGLRRHLRFIEARCSAHGVGVALVFAELRPIYAIRTFAVAWRSSTPTSSDDDWSGATGLLSWQDHEEFVHVMGRETVACP